MPAAIVKNWSTDIHLLGMFSIETKVGITVVTPSGGVGPSERVRRYKNFLDMDTALSTKLVGLLPAIVIQRTSVDTLFRQHEFRR